MDRDAGWTHSFSVAQGIGKTGLTIVARGEFSIIMANLGKEGGLMDIVQPFAAIYVLMLAIMGPLLTKQSKPIFNMLNKVFKFKDPRLRKEERNSV